MIKILADTNNERGDLITRLISDIFYSLGYEQLRFNVHQTGREVDIIGTHCTEDRILVAECKATEAPIGGRDLNTFSGVLDAERRMGKNHAAGYFASISGFTESAIQQELDLGSRFTLLGPKEIITHLVRGRIVVPEAHAISQASKFLAADRELKLGPSSIIAHKSGWYWLVIFANSIKQDTAYSIVHADGFVLSRSQGEELARGIPQLNELEYLGPDVERTDSQARRARERYINHLVKEYGYITLEGLPADQEVGSRSLRLENIFVPLSLEKIPPEALKGVEDGELPDGEEGHSLKSGEASLAEQGDDMEELMRLQTSQGNGFSREIAGKVLADNGRLAVLGSPGCGKTTLLKRIAVAYASPSRRTESEDALPMRDWFPIVIRCRHLGPDVSAPILKTIENLAERAEMPDLKNAFRECVTAELRAGKVLLLIDGLDEIASPTDRSSFVSQLRTFLGTYPPVSLVVTSREFGFRTVAGAVASLCTTYRVAELSDDDVKTITLSWHREVVGPGIRVMTDASELAASILRTDRVRRLAVNPLLLTTLLLVRRWLGELPRKRSVLYSKAIEVLLMTWNVEGHQPLDPDEALPQLAFAAFCMMQQNVQSVSIKELTGYFSEARRQMPELLGYSRISVSEFVSRVEERSSLLNLSGYIVEDGQLRATYEFKHLTFQEYLAALAAAEGYYPDRRDGEQLVDVLSPYLTKSSWREVIPLAGVLGGRSSGALVERIIHRIDPEDWKSVHDNSAKSRTRRSLWDLLSQCLADEVPLARETLRKAIAALITQSPIPVAGDVLSSRYGPEVYEVAKNGFDKATDNFMLSFGSTWAQAALANRRRLGSDMKEFAHEIIGLFESPDSDDRVEGCLLAMHVSFLCTQFHRYGFTGATGRRITGSSENFASFRQSARTIVARLIRVLTKETDRKVIIACTWALCWATGMRKITQKQTTTLLTYAWKTWQQSQDEVLQRLCAWLIWSLPVFPRGTIQLEIGPTSFHFLKTELATDGDSWQSDRQRAVLNIAYYLGNPWTDAELLKIATSNDEPPITSDRDWLEAYLPLFGRRGLAALQRFKEKEQRRVQSR